MAGKTAIFIHGWGTQDKLWRKDSGPLEKLFRSRGYNTVLLTVPGRFTDKERGFRDAAVFLADQIEAQSRQGFDDITLVGHSMGGVTVRLYMMNSDIGSAETKKKVKRVITLCSPHHGTTSQISDILRNTFSVVGAFGVLPVIFLSLTNVAGALAEGKCYLQAFPDSDFMKEFNKIDSLPSGAKWHCLWIKNDSVVQPPFSAILTGADNYYCSNPKLMHTPMVHNKQIVQLITRILDGETVVYGPQEYPAQPSCPDGTDHLWFPAEKQTDKYRWHCNNVSGERSCKSVAIAENAPSVVGCEIGVIKKRWHKWVEYDRRLYKCGKCDLEGFGSDAPSGFAKPRCGIKPWPSWHRWILQYKKWECRNQSCTATAQSVCKPDLYGCEYGSEVEKYHSWHKGESWPSLKFKCAKCGLVTIVE